MRSRAGRTTEGGQAGFEVLWTKAAGAALSESLCGCDVVVWVRNALGWADRSLRRASSWQAGQGGCGVGPGALG